MGSNPLLTFTKDKSGLDPIQIATDYAEEYKQGKIAALLRKAILSKPNNK